MQQYIDEHWAGLVRVVRSDQRLGLIRARLLGARHSKGPVLTFLDSHCECNLQWAEPILDVIGKDETIVVGSRGARERRRPVSLSFILFF